MILGTGNFYLSTQGWGGFSGHEIFGGILPGHEFFLGISTGHEIFWGILRVNIWNIIWHFTGSGTFLGHFTGS